MYRAHDPALDRRVALKVLRGGPRGDSLREARLQAQLEHPHIARIVETGIFQGRPAVAMEIVDGPTLDDAVEDLDLADRLRVMEQVARAVATAHRGGLIHRDLKPSNVLVERTADGPRAVVVDFGLATEVEAPGATVTGSVHGTPEYMAPEQLRGERTRSSDLYALGVMLFEIASGRRPHEGGSRTETMLARLSEPAPPLARVVPGISADLAAVVDRCLAFEPEARYSGVDDLADDLAALRRGEPVTARPLGPIYRAGSWIRRHRLLSAVAAAALVVVVLFAVTAWVERQRGLRRAELAQDFSRRAADIEWRLRVIEMSPRHDSTAGRRALEDDRAELEARMRRLGELAEAPGSAALGRAALALGRPDAAVEPLRRALEAGEPTHRALARALALLYRRQMTVAAGIRDDADRAATLAALRSTYAEPAAALLERADRSAVEGDDATEGDDLPRALLAFLDRGWDEAGARAAKALESRPWLYEAELLRADISIERAAAARSDGEPRRALEHYGSARAALERALEIADSSLAARVALCRLSAAILDLGRVSLGSSSDDAAEIERGRRDCRLAAEVAPERADVHSAWAALEIRAGLAADRSSADATGEIFERAERLAERAVALEPSAQTLETLGSARTERSVFLGARGDDPRPALRSAIEALERSVALEPSASRWRALGSASVSLARHESRRGGDAAPVLKRAIDAHRQATALAPERIELHLELSQALQSRGLHLLDHGGDAEPSLLEAIAAAERALEIEPLSFNAVYRRGVSRWYLGDAQFHRGDRSAIETLELALDDARRASRLDPDFARAVLLQANVAQTLAYARIRFGDDPRADWDVALTALDAVRTLDPSMVWTSFVRGRVLFDRAAWTRETATASPESIVEESLAPSRAAFHEGLAVHDEEPHAHADLGWTWVEDARLRTSTAQRALARAEASFAKALEIDAGCVPCLEGMATTLEARARADAPETAEPLLARATEILERAASEDARNPRVALARARLEIARCELLPSTCPEALARGAAAVERALTLDPGSREALGWRGALDVLIVERRADTAGLDRRADEARESLARAVDGRPELEARFAPWSARLDDATDRPP